MKKLVFISAISAAIILGACTRESSDRLVTIDIAANLHCDDTGDLTTLMQPEWAFIPELTDSTMLGYPQVVGFDGNIVYLNEQTRMLRYDGNSGKCLSSFDNSGEGPGHYLPELLSAYKVPIKSEWMVYEYNSMMRYLFTAEGTPLSETNVGEKFTILPCGDGWLTLNERTASKKVFTRLSPDFEVIDSIVAPFPTHVMKEGISHSPLLSVAGKNVIFLETDAPADTLFTFGPTGGMKPLAAIELGNIKMPQFESYETYKAEKDKYLWYQLTVAGNLAIVFYNFDGKYTVQIYSLTDGMLKYSHASTTIETAGLPFEIDGNTVYGFPMNFNGDDAMYIIVPGEFTASVTGHDESNPMIIKVRV